MRLKENIRLAHVSKVKSSTFFLMALSLKSNQALKDLIHVSEMSWVKNITDPSEVVKKGDEVEAIVLSVQKEEGKISLGIKQTEHNPWDDVERNIL